MDFYKDDFCGYSIYYKSYKRQWKPNGYFAKKGSDVFEYDGTTIFPTINELYSKIREVCGVTDYEYTDPYNIALKWYEDEENKENEKYELVGLLLNQYYYGLQAKKDLELVLSEMGLYKC